jgi:streptogramin lyase
MSLRRRKFIATTAATMTASLALAAPMMAPASGAAAPSDARTLDSAALAPFQVAVRAGTVWWTDGFAGTLTRLRNGHKTVIAHVNGEIAGVAVSGRKTAFTSSPSKSFQRLTIRTPGHKSVIANLKAYENNHNPDANRTYGIISGGNSCARQFFQQATGSPPRYQGIKDSHPYQVEALPGGSWAVAEAAGNDILRVNSAGRISTIAVLPRQAVTFTKKMADALGAPDCVVGVKYGFEPVPTDVERDRHGNLWVSLLPGGPEDPSLGARGAVYKITPSGKVIRVAKGFLGATNLAVAPGGKIYVAELFAGRISTIRNGHIVTVRKIARPASVEVTKKNLFVGQLADVDESNGNVKAPGGVYRFPR